MLPRRVLVAVLVENMKKEMKGLTPADFEMIERIIYKNGDDIAVSVSRSFERLEQRLDAAESRIYSRLVEMEGATSSELEEMRALIEDESEAVVGEK